MNKLVGEPGFMSKGQEDRVGEINNVITGGEVIGLRTTDRGYMECLIIKNNGKYYDVKSQWDKDDGWWYTCEEIPKSDKS